MARARILVDDRTHLFAEADPLWIVLSRDAPTMKSMDEIAAELDAASERLEKVGFLVQVPGGVKPPDGDVRKVGAEILARNAPGIRCALVLEGTGFWASAIRSVFAAITLMAGKAETRVFASVPDSYVWLETELDLPRGSLTHVVTPLRERPIVEPEATP